MYFKPFKYISNIAIVADLLVQEFVVSKEIDYCYLIISCKPNNISFDGVTAAIVLPNGAFFISFGEI